MNNTSILGIACVAIIIIVVCLAVGFIVRVDHERQKHE